ncbi:DUF4142 domain-containing protein [Streptomyces sp. NPDC028635]|uniref:DUF4142 domain-containing protein n=1 Tax=Streptomyces sp. NPDC028635 TaxID=3154800 RepID=UPI0033EB72F7
MRPRPPVQGRGIVSGTGLIIAGLTATLLALIVPIWSYADRPTDDGRGGTADTLSTGSAAGTDAGAGTGGEDMLTQYGVLSALDRDFVFKVRLAGLWELPAGRLAQARGTTDAVRTAGRHLVEGHTFLDERVRGVAAQLGLPLPDQPNEQQQAWLRQLRAARGADFDRTFANILRLAHGRVLTLVAEVRAGTRNALVRGLADDADTTVLDHIRVLEATGYVDFDALARDLAASASPPASVRPGNGTSHTHNTVSGW